MMKNRTVYIYKSLDELDYFFDIKENSLIFTQHSTPVMAEKYPNHFILDRDDVGSYDYISEKISKYNDIFRIWSFNPIIEIDQYHAMDIETIFCNFHYHKALDDKINQIMTLKGASLLLKRNIEKKEEIFKTKYYIGKDILSNTSIVNDSVITSQFSHGGNGVYLAEDCDLFSSINSYKIFRVERYIESAIPVCQTGIVYYDGVILFEPCIQIIRIIDGRFKYCGILAKEIASRDCTSISTLTLQIGETLRKSGFRGIFGCDYHLVDGQVLFSELNPRYVGSALVFEKAYQSFSTFNACIDAHNGKSYKDFSKDYLFIPWESSFTKYERFYSSDKGEVASYNYSFTMS